MVLLLELMNSEKVFYKDIYKYFGLEHTKIKNITKKLLNK